MPGQLRRRPFRRASPGPRNLSRPTPSHYAPLSIGERVFLQNQQGNHPTKWDRSGTVMESTGHDQYRVKVDGSGRLTLRNRRFLLAYTPVIPSFSQEPTAAPHSTRIRDHLLHPHPRAPEPQFHMLPQAEVESPPVDAPTTEETTPADRPSTPVTTPTSLEEVLTDHSCPGLTQPPVFPPPRSLHTHQHRTSNHAPVAIGYHQNIMSRKLESG